jgi:hypothetical protein
MTWRPPDFARDWEWLRGRALTHAAAARRWSTHPAAILAGLHVLLMLLVRSLWLAAIRQYGMPVGTGADVASGIAAWLDLPVNWFCEAVAYGRGPSVSPLPYWLLSLFGVRSLSDLPLGVHWPLLLILGTAQWFLIGLVIAYVRGRRRPRYTQRPPMRHAGR